jgi:hypothetical protein
MESDWGSSQGYTVLYHDLIASTAWYTMQTKENI